LISSFLSEDPPPELKKKAQLLPTRKGVAIKVRMSVILRKLNGNIMNGSPLQMVKTA
jgi:hypothetical protein